MKEQRLFVSVVIATYKRERPLCNTIRDVLAQDYDPFEVLVIDQSPGHEPETIEFLRAHAAQIRYFRLEMPNLPAARNYSIRQSRGEIVLFVDDDVEIPSKQFIQAHLAGYRGPRIKAVAGRLTIPNMPVVTVLNPRHRDPYTGWRYTNFSYTSPIEVATVYGANMSFRRETLLELGGFDENYTNPAYNEDVDLSMRLRAKGYSIMFEPSAHVIHHTYNAGGCENKYIHGKSQEAQVYYRGYWKNYFYFILKNVPNHHCLPLLWHLYRSHVLNLPYLRIGIRYVLAQHWIVACAAWDALKLWRRWRRGTVRAYI